MKIICRSNRWKVIDSRNAILRLLRRRITIDERALIVSLPLKRISRRDATVAGRSTVDDRRTVDDGRRTMDNGPLNKGDIRYIKWPLTFPHGRLFFTATSIQRTQEASPRTRHPHAPRLARVHVHVYTS